MGKKKLSLGKKILYSLLAVIVLSIAALVALKLTAAISTSWLEIFSPFILLAFILVIVFIAGLLLAALEAMLPNEKG